MKHPTDNNNQASSSNNPISLQTAVESSNLKAVGILLESGVSLDTINAVLKDSAVKDKSRPLKSILEPNEIDKQILKLLNSYKKLKETITIIYKTEEDYNNLTKIISQFTKDNLTDTKTICTIDGIEIKLNARGILNAFDINQYLSNPDAFELLKALKDLPNIAKIELVPQLPLSMPSSLPPITAPIPIVEVQLDLSSKEINDEGAKELAKTLIDLQHPNCKVTNLNLFYNQIGDVGVKAIAQALEHPECKVTNINLGGNRIDDEGTKAIAQALKHPECKVTNIDLSVNQIGIEGAKAIAKSLLNPQCKVEKIDISSNQDYQEAFDICIKIRQDKKKMMTFLLGRHPRVGIDSPVKSLIDDVLGIIYDELKVALPSDSPNSIISAIKAELLGGRGQAARR